MSKDSIKNTSIILPAFNEEEYLPDLLDDLLALDLENSEIIIVEDGCTDETPDICEKYAEENEMVKHIHYDERLGKGKAIKKALNEASKEFSLFVDADYSCRIEDIINVRNLLDEGADFALGSKYDHKDSEFSLSRKLQGKGYNYLTRKVLGTNLTDHQCGLKAFRTEEGRKFFANIREEKWFFDTELINQAKNQGLEIKEVPVIWEERPSKVPSYAPLLGIETLYKIKLEQMFSRSLSDILGQYNRFASVGAIGAIINTVLLFILTDFANIWYMASAVISTEVAIISMFLMNNKITFKPVKSGLNEMLRGIINSNIVRSAGIVVQLGLLYLLVEYGNIHYVVSNILAIFIASALTFYGEKYHNWQK